MPNVIRCRIHYALSDPRPRGPETDRAPGPHPGDDYPPDHGEQDYRGAAVWHSAGRSSPAVTRGLEGRGP